MARGSASMTSGAVTESAQPTARSAKMPALPSKKEAAQAASKGEAPRAATAAAMPERTSPLPPFARAGVPSAL